MSEVNFENTVKALESSTRELDEAWGLIAHLDSVCNSEELRNAHNEMLPAISEFSAKIPLDAKACGKRLNALQRLMKQKNFPKLISDSL